MIRRITELLIAGAEAKRMRLASKGPPAPSQSPNVRRADYLEKLRHRIASRGELGGESSSPSLPSVPATQPNPAVSEDLSSASGHAITPVGRPGLRVPSRLIRVPPSPQPLGPCKKDPGRNRPKPKTKAKAKAKAKASVKKKTKQ